MRKIYKILAVLIIFFLEAYIGLPMLKSGDTFLICAGVVYTLCLIILLGVILYKKRTNVE